MELDDDDDAGHPTYTWLSTVGDRAFPVAGSRLWNSHLSINYAHCFSNRLKTYKNIPDHFLPNCYRFLVLTPCIVVVQPSNSSNR